MTFFEGFTPDDDTVITRQEWHRRSRPSPTHPAETEPAQPVLEWPAGRRPNRRRGRPDNPLDWHDCELCEGSGWIAVPDPLFGGALVDTRCPACEDTTVRAGRSRWESDDGRKVGPP